jgi:hypothetical protein
MSSTRRGGGECDGDTCRKVGAKSSRCTLRHGGRQRSSRHRGECRVGAPDNRAADPGSGHRPCSISLPAGRLRLVDGDVTGATGSSSIHVIRTDRSTPVARFTATWRTGADPSPGTANANCSGRRTLAPGCPASPSSGRGFPRPLATGSARQAALEVLIAEVAVAYLRLGPFAPSRGAEHDAATADIKELLSEGTPIGLSSGPLSRREAVGSGRDDTAAVRIWLSSVPVSETVDTQILGPVVVRRSGCCWSRNRDRRRPDRSRAPARIGGSIPRRCFEATTTLGDSGRTGQRLSRARSNAKRPRLADDLAE